MSTITAKKLSNDNELVKAVAKIRTANGNLTEVTLESYCFAGARVISNRQENGKSSKGNRAVDLQILSGGIYNEVTKKYDGGLNAGLISKAITVLDFYLKDIVSEGSRPTAEQCDEALQIALSQLDSNGELIALHPQYLIASGKAGEEEEDGNRTPDGVDAIAKRLVKRAIKDGLNKDDIWEIVLKAYYAETKEG